MTITAIRQTSPGRMTIEFDDGSEIKSTLGVVTDHLLFTGKELDNCGLDNIKTASVRSLTLEKAIEYLSIKQMSAKDLYDKLILKGQSEDTAEYCVNKLKNLGILDDSKYASSLARHYASRGYGPGKIRNELYRHGVERELYDNAVGEAPLNYDKIEKIVSSHLKDPNDKAQIKKTTDALYRRGFTWDEIKTILRNYIDNLELEDF